MHFQKKAIINNPKIIFILFFRSGCIFKKKPSLITSKLSLYCFFAVDAYPKKAIINNPFNLFSQINKNISLQNKI